MWHRKEERSSSGKKFIRVIKLNLSSRGFLSYFAVSRFSRLVRKFWRMAVVGFGFYPVLVGKARESLCASFS